MNHVKQAALIGADVATVPPATLKALVKHPLTDKGLETVPGRLGQDRPEDRLTFRNRSREQFQEKWERLFRPELRENKDLEGITKSRRR